MELKKYFPWWSKIFLKIILSRLPFSYQFWGQKIGLFKLGHMLNAEYAWEIFNFHYSRTASYLPEKFVVCELGPGDLLSTALIAPCFGGIESYLIDVGSFAANDIKFYNKLANFLSEKQLTHFVYSSDFSLGELMKQNNAHYLVNGLLSLRDVPDESVDFVFSHAVLEHIRLKDFNNTIKELYRIQKPGGIASHHIDLKDHLGGRLNNLRFSNNIWESDFFSSSGFYTNRLRANNIIDMIKRAGFKIVLQEEHRWEKLPTPRHKLDGEFSNLSEENLLIHDLDIVYRK